MQSALVESRICLQRAEHMLGSAFVKCDLTYPQTPVNRRIAFSEELSSPNTPLLSRPQPAEPIDILVIECTAFATCQLPEQNRSSCNCDGCLWPNRNVSQSHAR